MTADGGGHSPKVGIVMRNRSRGVVVFLCGAFTAFGKFGNQADQRLLTFGQIQRKCRPVVHFGVDIDGVVAVPRWHDTVIPNALQIRRLSTFAGGGNGQIFAEIEV